MESGGRGTRIGELVGLAAVVGSLLFVGLQVRQAAQATRGATQQQLSAGAREASLVQIDPDFAALLARAREADWSALEPAEQVRLSAFYRIQFRISEEAHYQFGLGNLDPELWAGYEAVMTQVIESGGRDDYWSQERTRFSAPFRALVDSLLAAQ